MKEHIVRIPHTLWLAMAELAHEQGRTVSGQVRYELKWRCERWLAAHPAPVVKPAPAPEPVSSPLGKDIPHYNEPVQESFKAVREYLLADAKRRH